MLKSFFSLELGRDFWNFRIGQLVSLLGDACSSIALAWWVLDKTGSAAEMSQVMVPAMLARIFLLPVFGPLADRLSRKALIVVSDLWRFAFGGVICWMVYANRYDLVLLIVCYTSLSAGSALFQSAAGGIIAQIVSRDKLQLATQQSQALNSLGGVVGGILGGVIVTTAGVLGAFLVDAVSYLLAAYCTYRIQADTRPQKSSTDASSLGSWKRDLAEGFAIVYRLPVLFWLCVIAMFLNLCLAPIGLILPVLAKESRGMPPWFLGGLESAISLGAILGAMSIGYVQKFVRGQWLMVIAIMMIGLGVALLPWVPNALLPLTVLFWVGVASTWANIPLGTQLMLALPDQYRGRVGSILNFLCSGISPLGVAAVGFLLAQFGLSQVLMGMGIAVMVLSPLLFLVPLMGVFMGAAPDEVGEFFEKHYPGAMETVRGDSIDASAKANVS